MKQFSDRKEYRTWGFLLVLSLAHRHMLSPHLLNRAGMIRQADDELGDVRGAKPARSPPWLLASEFLLAGRSKCDGGIAKNVVNKIMDWASGDFCKACDRSSMIDWLHSCTETEISEAKTQK